MPRAESWRYEKLTWPEINDAIVAEKVVVVPVGSIEQHGPHLPLDVDVVCPTGVAHAAARIVPDKALVMPALVHGYTAHVMDFPGTINIHWQHFIEYVMDVCKSLAYHGFKRIVLLNGHGSNYPNLDLAARRINLETDARCSMMCWWSLLTVDPKFLPAWRESEFPGGCAHAGELETSVYLYLDGDNVRRDHVADGDIRCNRARSSFQWVDLFAAGPVAVTGWTAQETASGIMGRASLATAEKGRQAVAEASRQLASWIADFRAQPTPERGEAHRCPPTMPMPWGQCPNPGGAQA